MSFKKKKDQVHTTLSADWYDSFRILGEIAQL